MKIRVSGDTLLLVEWEQTIDPIVNERAIQLAERLTKRIGAIVRDIVPSYCSVGVHFDPLLTDLAALERTIEEEGRHIAVTEESTPKTPVEIPVRYGGAEGPDLDGVAEWAQMTPADVVEAHTSATYRVYMLGFVPGFSYMGRVDARIAAPRRRVPRERVPAGSVGIAGQQTGIYPIVTPGGWQIIGRTDSLIFDATRVPPNLLSPGDLVRFVPVSARG